MSGPQEHAKKYDKYSDLVTKKAEADVERFLLEGHNFDRFAVVGICIYNVICLPSGCCRNFKCSMNLYSSLFLL